MRLFDLREIPAVRGPLPSRVSDVHFSVDLSELIPLDAVTLTDEEPYLGILSQAIDRKRHDLGTITPAPLIREHQNLRGQAEEPPSESCHKALRRTCSGNDVSALGEILKTVPRHSVSRWFGATARSALRKVPTG